MGNGISIKDDRRAFLCKMFSSCAFCCFAAPLSFASDGISDPFTPDQKHKFQSDSELTMQQVYDFAFKQWYIPAMKNFMLQMGKEKFLKMLKISSEMLYTAKEEVNFSYDERTLTAFAENLKKSAENYYKHRCSFEFIRSDDHVLEMRTTECLWAKTFREADAADIGYAGICYQDYPAAKAYHPKLTFIRGKTLMQGHEYCENKWIMET